MFDLYFPSLVFPLLCLLYFPSCVSLRIFPVPVQSDFPVQVVWVGEWVWVCVGVGVSRSNTRLAS